MTEALNKLLLLVDDDPNILRIHATILTQAGFNVLMSPGARHALDLLQAGCPVGAIVTDLTMPGMNGIDFIKRIRTLRASVPVILLTGYWSAEVADCAADFGVFRYLAKPVSANELVLVIMQAMQIHSLE